MRLSIVLLVTLCTLVAAQENAKTPLKSKAVLTPKQLNVLIKKASRLTGDFNFLLRALPIESYTPLPAVQAKNEQGEVIGEIWEKAKPKGGKVYRIHYKVSASPDRVKEVLWDLQGMQDSWNPSVLRVRIKEMNNQTRVSYSETKKQAGGLIAGREFIDMWRIDDYPTNTTIAFKSVHFPELLAQFHKEDTVRAYNLLSGYQFHPSKEDPSVTTLVYIINVDYKLKIVSSSIADSLAPSNTMKFIQALVHEIENPPSITEEIAAESTADTAADALLVREKKA